MDFGILPAYRCFHCSAGPRLDSKLVWLSGAKDAAVLFCPKCHGEQFVPMVDRICKERVECFKRSGYCIYTFSPAKAALKDLCERDSVTFEF